MDASAWHPGAPLALAQEGGAPLVIEPELIERRLSLDGLTLVELGCGRADLTRKLATAGARRRIVAFEVDRIQHAKNLEIADLPSVEFRLGGAEAIDAADASFDGAFLFKSLHHVPIPAMGAALREIARVLRPGGFAWISEPVFAGPFNEIMRLFHDEQRVRAAAFDAVRAAVEAGVLESAAQAFFEEARHFEDFAAFERRMIGVTHTRHDLSEAVLAEVRRRFEAHMRAGGARFRVPMRVNLLRRAAAA